VTIPDFVRKSEEREGDTLVSFTDLAGFSGIEFVPVAIIVNVISLRTGLPLPVLGQSLGEVTDAFAKTRDALKRTPVDVVGVNSVILFELDDGVDNPLPAFPEVQVVNEGLKQWLAESPTSKKLTVVGSYRPF
jgi:hypothetical protein